MSSPFRGYLYKSVKTGQPFPNQYIQFNTFKTTPNQREEIKAYRDDNTRDLTRITAEGKKSTFKHKTRKSLHLNDIIAIQQWFDGAEESTAEAHEQRKVELEYWDNENFVYKSGYFYRPNLEFPIIRIEEDDIIYDDYELKFIEY